MIPVALVIATGIAVYFAGRAAVMAAIRARVPVVTPPRLAGPRGGYRVAHTTQVAPRAPWHRRAWVSVLAIIGRGPLHAWSRRTDAAWLWARSKRWHAVSWGLSGDCHPVGFIEGGHVLLGRGEAMRIAHAAASTGAPAVVRAAAIGRKECRAGFGEPCATPGCDQSRHCHICGAWPHEECDLDLHGPGDREW